MNVQDSSTACRIKSQHKDTKYTFHPIPCHEGTEGEAVFLNPGARWWWAVKTTSRSLSPGNTAVTIVQEAGLILGKIWKEAEDLLYRDSIPGPSNP